MMTNAEKIQQWRDEHPGEMLTKATLKDILGRTNLSGAYLGSANLRGADLSDANLDDAYLSDANLRDANLYGASLYGAQLRGANLRDADLSCAYLTSTDLWGANLWGAILWRADLRGANLWKADLTSASLANADLRGAGLAMANLTDTRIMDANLTGSTGGVAQIDNIYRYPATLQPTPDGWHTRVGCWYGTLEELHGVATSDDDGDWPEARGDERERRRPLLQAILTMFDAHTANYPDIIDDLAERWTE